MTPSNRYFVWHHFERYLERHPRLELALRWAFWLMVAFGVVAMILNKRFQNWT